MNRMSDDDIINQENSKNSKYSFYLGLSSIGIIILITGLTYLKLSNRINDSLHSIVNIVLAIALFTIGITGIQYTVKSVKQKESFNLYKTIGIIINLSVLIIFLSLIYTVVKDINNAF